MKIPFPTPNGLVERSYVESGPIERMGFQDYSVIMTTSPGHSASNFNPNHLAGVLIENTHLPATDPDRYFTILGGYYLSAELVNGNYEPKTLNVFGIALDNSLGFEITEGGSNVLSDRWQLKNPPAHIHPVAGIRERNFAGGNVPIEDQTGWTFIVAEVRDYTHYPPSQTLLKFYNDCPTLLRIDTSPGSLQPSGQTVQFTAVYEGIDPTEFVWNFGDGSPAKSTQTHSVSHTFARPAGDTRNFSVTVELRGPGACISQQTLVWSIPGVCPILTEISVLSTHVDENGQTFQFTASMDGPDADSYLWDWGDGSPNETTNVPVATHTFARPTGDSEVHKVKVTLIGPDTCHSSGEVDVTLSGICPVLTDINLLDTVIGDQAQSIQFEVVYDGPDPHSFTWDWGDGTPSETTQVPTASHDFKRPEGDDSPITVKVIANGPDSCQATLQIPVELKGVCPILQDIQFVVDQVSPDTQNIRFTALVSGPQPVTYEWNWGDGTELEITTSPNVFHLFQQPPGGDEEVTVELAIVGPGNCRSTGTAKITLPGVCPLIQQIKTQSGQMGDTSQEVIFTVDTEGPLPESYTWDWGDDSPPETSTVATLAHTYSRPAGDLETYTVTVQVKGPATCDSTGTTTVSIAGTCPVVGQITSQAGPITENSFELTFSVGVQGPDPDSFVWDFGDGTAQQTTTGPTATHVYNRPPGDPSDIQVSVTLKGPDTCESHGILGIRVPGVCPVLTEIKTEFEPAGDQEQVVTFSVTHSGPAPELYIWDWGDGSPLETTQSPDASHTYARPHGDGEEREVLLTVRGPGSCETQAETKINIPGLCPLILDLKQTASSTGEGELSVQFELVMSGPGPSRIEWDWGDGSPIETSTSAIAIHNYAMPPGDAETYTARVRIIGPGSCASERTSTVQVPGLCPVIFAVSPQLGILTDGTQEVSVDLNVIGPIPQRYEWDWGDGSPMETTKGPSARHEYQRASGKPSTYTLRVKSIGPETCESSTEATISIQGSCPVIGILAPQLIHSDGTRQQMDFKLEVDNGMPDAFEWDWGDGSPVEQTTVPQATHIYEKTDAERTYTVSVRTTGPGDCIGEAEARVTVGMEEIECPAITMVKAVKVEETADSVTFDLTLDLDNGKPDQFEWNWGDGSASEITGSPRSGHVFKKHPDKPLTLSIQVNGYGPGDCQASGFTTVQIPQAEDTKEPWFCTLLTLLGGLFLALAGGTGVTWFVGENYPAAGADEAAWPLFLMLGFAGVFILLVLLYYWRGGVVNCPPTKCDWFAWLMAAFLTETAVSTYLLKCTEEPWWIVPIVCFVIAGVFGYLWFRSCAVHSRARRFFAYLAIFLVASAIVIFGISNPYLACV